MTFPSIYVTDIYTAGEVLSTGKAYDDHEDVDLEGPFQHVISLRSPTPENDPPGGWNLWNRYPARKLRLLFDDVEGDREGYWQGPKMEHVQSLIDFSKGVGSDRVLIHCTAGVSRSPGAALVMIAAILGPGQEEAIFDNLTAIKNSMRPHRSLAHYADVRLGFKGTLIRGHNDRWGDRYTVEWPDPRYSPATYNY